MFLGIVTTPCVTSDCVPNLNKCKFKSPSVCLRFLFYGDDCAYAAKKHLGDDAVEHTFILRVLIVVLTVKNFSHPKFQCIPVLHVIHLCPINVILVSAIIYSLRSLCMQTSFLDYVVTLSHCRVVA